MSEHVLKTPKTCGHDPEMEGRCNVCDYGLAICSKCGKGEADLYGPCIPLKPRPTRTGSIPTAFIRAKTSVEVELTNRDISAAIRQVVGKMTFPPDDAGCDWRTDNQGRTYIDYPMSCEKISDDPNVATLVDAANVLSIGKVLKVENPG